MSPHLPWLIRHGETLGYVLCVVTLLLGARLGLWLLGRVPARGAMRRRAALGAPTDAVAEGLGTLRGRLEPEAPIPRLDDRQPCAATTARSEADCASSRAGVLRLRVGEQTVLVEGPVEVEVGTHEREAAWVSHPWLAERVASAEHHREGDRGSTVSLRSLAPGAAVVAFGRIETRVDTGVEADYRSASTQAVLVPAPGYDVVRVAAYRARRLPGGWIERAAAGVAGAGLGLGLVFGAGWALVEGIPGPTDAPPRSGVVATLATMSPFHRDRALERLARHYRDSGGPWDLDRARTALGLGGEAACDRVLAAIADRVPSDALAAVADGCPDESSFVADRLAGEGRFSLASDRLDAHPPGDDASAWARAGYTHLLAGHHDRAAAAARAQREHLPPYATRWSSESLRCLALALDAAGGDDARIDDLAEERSDRDRVAEEWCGFLHRVAAEHADREPLPDPPGSMYQGWLLDVYRAAHGHWPTSLSASSAFALDPSTFGPTGPRVEVLFLGALFDRALSDPPPLPTEAEDASWLAGMAEPPASGLPAHHSSWRALRRRIAPHTFHVAIAAERANARSLLGDPESARASLRRVRPTVEWLTRNADRLAEAGEEAGVYDRYVAGVLSRWHAVVALVELRAGDFEAAAEPLEAAERRFRDGFFARTLSPISEPDLDRDALEALFDRQLAGTPERAALLAAHRGNVAPIAAGEGATWSLARVTTPPHEPGGVSLLAVVLHHAGSGRHSIRSRFEAVRPWGAIGVLPYGVREQSLLAQVARELGSDALEAEIADARARYRRALSDAHTGLLLAVWTAI